jgi:hypothetical protein
VISRRALLTGGAAFALAGASYAGWRDFGSLADYHALVAASRLPLASGFDAHELIRYATLAANSHNSQPWLFRVTDQRIDILPDPSRHLSAVDPDDHHLFASLGCAQENLRLAATMRGRPGLSGFDASAGGSATVTFGGGAAAEPALFNAIPMRQSTRGEFDGRSVSADKLAALAAAAAVPGVDLVLVTERVAMNRVRDLVVAGNATQMGDAAFMRELTAWLRFSPRLAMAKGDGLFSLNTGNPPLPDWFGRIAFDYAVTAASENDKYARQIASSAGIAVFVGETADPEHWVLAGRACQRFALCATDLGLKHAFINQPVEVAGLRPELAALVGLPGRRPDIVMRFGYGPVLPFSARRPVSTVMA